MSRISAYPPPFPIGGRVRYVGSYGWNRYSGTEPKEEIPLVEPGAIGVVVSVHAGLDGHPELGDPDLADPLDGWSVVKFDGPGDSNKAAVSREDAGEIRFELIDVELDRMVALGRDVPGFEVRS